MIVKSSLTSQIPNAYDAELKFEQTETNFWAELTYSQGKFGTIRKSKLFEIATGKGTKVTLNNSGALRVSSTNGTFVFNGNGVDFDLIQRLVNLFDEKFLSKNTFNRIYISYWKFVESRK